MDIKLVGALVAGFAAAAAMAQVNVGGVVGGSVGGAGGATGTTIDAGAAAPSVGRAVGDAGRATMRAALDAGSGNSVRVQAGARTRVARETRCYDDSGYWDPYYSDGYYYCETRTSGPGAGVKARVGG